jgi:hypothetical protein
VGSTFSAQTNCSVCSTNSSIIFSLFILPPCFVVQR